MLSCGGTGGVWQPLTQVPTEPEECGTGGRVWVCFFWLAKAQPRYLHSGARDQEGRAEVWFKRKEEWGESTGL